MSGNEEEEIEDENDREVNATGYSIVGYVWPSMTQEFHYYLSLVVTTFILVILTVIIAEKCLRQKLAGCAEHAFYCTLSQVLCMGEALILHSLTLHTVFGLVALCVGLLGVAIQFWLQQQLGPYSRQHWRSKHGVFGLVGSLLLLGCSVTGMWMFLQQLRNPIFFYLQLCHRVCGLVGFVVCMCSQMYSYNTDFMLRNWSVQHVALLKCATLIATITATVLVFQCVLQDVTKRIPMRLFQAIKIDEH